MTCKLLAIGDMHLGRRPTRLPEALAADADTLSSFAAWNQAVDLAIQEQVSAVILAGDVAESNFDYFEALPELTRGVQRLLEADIPTYAVSGNHDVKVLPLLAERIPAMHLLGAGGQWESATIEPAQHTGEPPITLWGWSFPTQVVSHSPLDDFPGRQAGQLNIGVLHCDRDTTDSRYAPVTTAALAHCGLDAWLLGHIHQPDPLTAANPSGYLGTLTGLDAGESGPRGPWLMHIEQGQITAMIQRPLGALRWQPLAVDLTDAATAEAITICENDALDALADALGEHADQPQVLGLRVRYVGDTHLSTAVIQATRIQSGRLYTLAQNAQIRYFVERSIIDVRPKIDVVALAQRDDQLGGLAQRLLILERTVDDAERQALLDRASAQTREMQQKTSWRKLADDGPDREQLAEWLRESGYRALRAMLEQVSP